MVVGAFGHPGLLLRARASDSFESHGPRGRHLEHVVTNPKGVVEMEVLVDRVAGLDVHKKTVTACVRVPGEGRERVEYKVTFPTFRDALEEMRDWLAEHDVSLVVMEATGVFWKPVWMVLEDVKSFELKLVNARHVKQVPGRKTDVGDAAWLASAG